MNSKGLKSIAMLAVALVIGAAPSQASSEGRDRASGPSDQPSQVKEVRMEIERLFANSYSEKVQTDIDRAIEGWVVAVTNADTSVTDLGLDAYIDSELSGAFHEAGLTQSESESELKSLIKTLASAELDRVLVKY